MAKPSTMSMKLVIHPESKRVIFAEADKNSVDFLIVVLLSLPIATVITQLKKDKKKDEPKVGSLGKFYESFSKMKDVYLQSNQSKDAILNPQLPNCGRSYFPQLLNEVASTERKFYICATANCCKYTDDPRTLCPKCNKKMETSMTYAAPPNKGRFVEEVLYRVMDNLEIKPPKSDISTINLLKEYKIKDINILEERKVTLGTTEAIKLLKASFRSDHVLTEVFNKDEADKAKEAKAKAEEDGKNRKN